MRITESNHIAGDLYHRIGDYDLYHSIGDYDLYHSIDYDL